MPRLPLALSALVLTSLPALAQTCPAPLADAHKLVLVTTRDMASTSATVQRFSRANPHAPWKPDGGPVSAIIGHNGMGWANAFRTFAKEGEPTKVDGDKKVPAGRSGRTRPAVRVRALLAQGLSAAVGRHGLRRRCALARLQHDLHAGEGRRQGARREH